MLSITLASALSLVVSPYTFISARHDTVAAELGRLSVPERHGKPGSGTIELVFVRFRCTSPHPGPPIVYLAGGPGGSGIAAARGSRFPLFMAMREFGDVISLDQRGTGMSNPNLNCQEQIDFPVDKALDREEMLGLFRKQSRACAQSWR